MSGNGFREEELVSRKVKVGSEWQTRVFPIIGGRLRIIHELNSRLSITTEIVRLESDFAVVKATMESEKGKFCGTGTASAQRDARLADALVELAETRAIARSLRFGGIGCEYTSAEEVSHVVAAAEPEREQSTDKQPPRTAQVAPRENKPETNSSNGAGRATQAQVRALHALSKRARYHDEDIATLLAPFQANRFEDLPREAASQLISAMQQEVAA